MLLLNFSRASAGVCIHSHEPRLCHSGGHCLQCATTATGLVPIAVISTQSICWMRAH